MLTEKEKHRVGMVTAALLGNIETGTRIRCINPRGSHLNEQYMDSEGTICSQGIKNKKFKKEEKKSWVRFDHITYGEYYHWIRHEDLVIVGGPDEQ